MQFDLLIFFFLAYGTPLYPNSAEENSLWAVRTGKLGLTAQNSKFGKMNLFKTNVFPAPEFGNSRNISPAFGYLPIPFETTALILGVKAIFANQYLMLERVSSV